ncbi:hypothetical protein BOX15_Mlig004932g1 [Macrostomum lignano]|uniref:Uncharacterized protein n=2 Tax=Macrostomum lignano TaxID=282301 RepID=A0A267H5W4_9PLAT|nr:hypothetical protein BOX15_Mlig004932g1 [Macrostomum lignano]
MSFQEGSGEDYGYDPNAAMPPIRRSAFSAAAAAADGPGAIAAGAAAPPPSAPSAIGSLMGSSFGGGGSDFNDTAKPPAAYMQQHQAPPHYHQQLPSIGGPGVPSLMQMSCRQPNRQQQQQYSRQSQPYYYRNQPVGAWRSAAPQPQSLLATPVVPQLQQPIGWPAAPLAIGSTSFGQHRQRRGGGGGGGRAAAGGNYGFPQPLMFATGRVNKPIRGGGGGGRQQQQQLQKPVGGIVPLMAGMKPDKYRRRWQQQPPSLSRPIIDVILDAQKVLREVCAEIDRKKMHVQAVVFAVRERVPDFHFHYVFALARDLDTDALRGYYGNDTVATWKAAADAKEGSSEDANKTESQIEDYTVLCDLYVCGIFAGVQGRGCNQLAARLDTCRRFINLLIDTETPPRIVDIRRAWQRGTVPSQAVVTYPEPSPSSAPADAPADKAEAATEEKPTADVEMPAAAAADAEKADEIQHPPMLSMSVGPASRHRFEMRARGVSQCLLKLLGNDPVSTCNVTAWEAEAAQPPSLLGDVGSSGGIVFPVMSADPWSASATSLSPQLDSLFVCHPAPHIAKVLPSIAQFRLTCHFNGLMKVTSSSVGPTVAEGRDRPSCTALLHIGNHLLSQADGDTMESAKTAAAVAFVESASQLQPVIRVHRTCPTSIPVVAKDALVAKGQELFNSEPEKYRSAMQQFFKQAGSGANPVMSRAFWQHLVAKQPDLEEFLLHSLAYLEAFHSEPLECRVFGGDLTFPEICTLYSCIMCCGFDFEVDAVLEDFSSVCHQLLLVHKQVDTVEVKRRLLTDKNFGRLELVSLGSRIDQVKSALDMPVA